MERQVNGTKNIVESLVTGEFQRVSKDFDPTNLKDQYAMTLKDQDGSGITSSSEILDHDMIQDQKIWLNRLANLFNAVVGILGGMAVLNFVVLYGLVVDVKSLEGQITYLFNFILAVQQILGTIAVITGLTLTMVYRAKADE